MFSLFRPYKKEWINYWDSTVFFLLFVVKMVYMYEKFISKSDATAPLLTVLITVPLVYICIYAIYQLLIRTAMIHRCTLLCKPPHDKSCNDVEAIFEREVSQTSEYYEPIITRADDLRTQNKDRDTYIGSPPMCGGSVYSYGSM